MRDVLSNVILLTYALNNLGMLSKAMVGFGTITLESISPLTSDITQVSTRQSAGLAMLLSYSLLVAVGPASIIICSYSVCFCYQTAYLLDIINRFF